MADGARNRDIRFRAPLGQIRVMSDWHSSEPPVHWMANIDYSGIEISVMAAMGITMGPCVVCGRAIMSCDKLQHYRSHRDQAHRVAEVMES